MKDKPVKDGINDGGGKDEEEVGITGVELAAGNLHENPVDEDDEDTGPEDFVCISDPLWRR